MYSISRRRVQHPCWSGSASGSHESVASKEIEDLDKLRDVKSYFPDYSLDLCLGKGSESEEMIVTSSSFP